MLILANSVRSDRNELGGPRTWPRRHASLPLATCDDEEQIEVLMDSVSKSMVLAFFAISSLVFVTLTRRRDKEEAPEGSEKFFFPPLPPPVVSLLR